MLCGTWLFGMRLCGGRSVGVSCCLCQSFEVHDGGGEVGLYGYVGETAACGACKAVLGFSFAVNAFGAPSMA